MEHDLVQEMRRKHLKQAAPFQLYKVSPKAVRTYASRHSDK